MSKLITIMIAASLACAVGCRSTPKRPPDPNTRTDISFPGGRVQVHDDGSKHVKAPFTDVQTSQYRQQPPKNSTQNNFDPPVIGEGSSRTGYIGNPNGDSGTVRKASSWSLDPRNSNSAPEKDVIQLPVPPKMDLNN